MVSQRQPNLYVECRGAWLSRRGEIKQIWSNWALFKSGQVQLWHFSTNHTSANVTSCNLRQRILWNGPGAQTKMTPLPTCPVLFWSHRFYLQTYLDEEDCHAKSQDIKYLRFGLLCLAHGFEQVISPHFKLEAASTCEFKRRVEWFFPHCSKQHRKEHQLCSPFARIKPSELASQLDSNQRQQARSGGI